MSVRIGIDVGGTFTDFVVSGLVGGALRFHKEPSVPDDPSLAVQRGLAVLQAEHGVKTGEVEVLVHGTTIGLNAIIQRRGAKLAFVVSRGNRDLLEIARLRMPSSYDVTAPREAALAPRDLVFEIGARLSAKGEVLSPVDPMEMDALALALIASGVEAVAVVLLNAYRDDRLEREVAEALEARCSDLPVTTSGAIWPEIREYERGVVAGLNASIQPLMTTYFDRLSQRLREAGLTAPVYITANNGGTLSLASARARPIDTVLSGPASGVVASARIGDATGHARLVTFDMGGTSADIALCQNGEPDIATSTSVGDFPLMLPVVQVGAIGAGGGSVVWVDPQGLLKIGPLSAGADPGPVCYGRGGREPTLTDCYLVLGYIDPDRFLGGRMRLDRAAALAALDGIAATLGYAGAERASDAAAAAVRVASAKMATEVVKLLATAGADPEEFALVAYGGAGPTQAVMLADDARLPTVLIPAAPGALCALGAILADVRRDYARTARHRIGAVTPAEDGWPALAATLTALEAEALDWLSREGEIIGAHQFATSFALRYVGQAYELTVTVPAAARPTIDGAALAALFHAEHERLYGFRETGTPVESATVRLGVIGRVAAADLPRLTARDAMPRTRRPVRHGGAWVDAAIYDRHAIGAGSAIRGPAVVEQADTTTVLPPGWWAWASDHGALVLRREGVR